MKINSLPKLDGKQLKIISIQKGLPLWRLAQLCGIQASRLSDYINGRRRPSESTLDKIALHLGIEKSAFLSINMENN